MDLTSPNTKSSPPPPPPSSSQPEAAESTETATALPSRIQTTKHLSFTNGVLKRHQQQQQQHHNHHHHHHHHPIVITYKECLKNHAASLGGHALDGCGEFMPSPTATATDPTSLKCAACGCHRNFHRRDPDDINTATATNNTTTVLAATAGNHNHHTATIEYQPHHRHHPPPPPTQPIPIPPPSNRSPNSSSPPPISSSYYPSAPHMLLALSGSLQQSEPVFGSGSGFGSSRKRFRTKFSHTQKEKMHEFAEKVGWKMQKRDEEIVNEFCNEVGVDRTVLKVWMHNNKNTLGKQLQNQQTQTQTQTATNGSIVRAINLENNSEDKKKDGEEEEEEEEEDREDNNNNGGGGGLNRHFESVAAVNGGGGGSSSSS